MDTRRSKRIPRFQKWMNGPFVVYFRQHNTPISTITLADALNKNYKSIIEVQQCNLGKVKVTFTERDEANHAVRNSEFTAHYHVHLPRHEVEIAGKIIDSGIDLSKLCKHGVGRFELPGLCNLPILECSTLARFSSEENKFVRTNGIRVTFPGNILPDFVQYNTVLYPIRLFVPKQMFCKQCQKFGHTMKFCSHRVQKHTEDDNNTCRFCNVSHIRVETCPVYKARALQTGTRYRDTHKQNYQHASTIYKNPNHTISTTITTTTSNIRANNKSHPVQAATAAEVATEPTTTATASRAPAPQTARKVNNAKHREPSQPKATDHACIPISLAELTSSLCNALSIRPEWRALIEAMMPVWRNIWDKIIQKYPLLGIFIYS